MPLCDQNHGLYKDLKEKAVLSILTFTLEMHVAREGERLEDCKGSRALEKNRMFSVPHPSAELWGARKQSQPIIHQTYPTPPAP